MVDNVVIQEPSKAIPGRAYKRSVKNIVIHKPMQREFSLVLIALLMISTLAIGFIIHQTIHSAVFGGGGYRFGKVSPYEILSDVSYQLIIRVSCVLFVTLIVIAMFGMLFLHRVAGPVYRFRLTFQTINRGDVPRPVKLREGDFFGETAGEINKLIRRMEWERNKQLDIAGRIEKLLSGRVSDALSDKLAELKKVCETPYQPEKLEKHAKTEKVESPAEQKK